MSENQLDLMGLKCPLPALKTRKALRGLAAGTEIAVHCSDPMAALDIPNLIRETGDTLLSTDRREDRLVFTIRKA